ncbi:carboxypeptidase-like regulatory domain-containing protein [Planctomicrobium sp. SH527]|uniref:carboxypeptidase-like regulatory domain-containing protein n=1 Tax=Planctomicrobium sp. SH527 TaxID=3448123 RepID=UPI003F5C315C
MRFHFPLHATLCAIAMTFLGCGGGTEKASLPNTVPVTGTIKLDGKPLAGATVVFVPKSGTAGIECTGTTDAEGRYTLKQLRGGDGAPPGTYSVVVSALVGPDGKPLNLPPDTPPADAGAVESLPPRYSSMTDSVLSATVPTEGGDFPFELKKR